MGKGSEEGESGARERDKGAGKSLFVVKYLFTCLS